MQLILLYNASRASASHCSPGQLQATARVVIRAGHEQISDKSMMEMMDFYINCPFWNPHTETH